mmetsp:Transcript_11693/g.29970  ORF Transcript_11693/g.29970 Transcript_11693/m.29970 type:complete len:245 (-) Transcript_11693:120-854(-)
MLPASPSITLITPVGGSSVSPPGRTMQNSRSFPGPEKKSCSWLFLSVKMFFITVNMRTLKKKGACFSESPAPIDVTTLIRFTPFAFIAFMTHVVPSVSIVAPTSFVLPPSATTTPSTSSVITLSTSAWLVTEPWTTVSLSDSNLVPALEPPEPGGSTSFDGVRTNVTTSSPASRAWKIHSLPVPPLPPMTAIFAAQTCRRLRLAGDRRADDDAPRGRGARRETRPLSAAAEDESAAIAMAQASS